MQPVCRPWLFAPALLAAPGSVAVPIFSRALMPQGEGVRAAVQLPSVAQLAALDRLELDLQLGCPGTSDKSCPEVGMWLGWAGG